MNYPSFEESLPLIDIEILKRKNKWHLDSLAWLDFKDVSQILRIHIYKKWKLYNPKKPLLPWINTIISHQITNLIRNHYQNYARPCLRCAAQVGEDECKIYGKQCEACPIYKDWKKKKEIAYNIKLPVSIENHTNEVQEKTVDNEIDLVRHIENAHQVMQKHLKPNEWIVYQKLFIEHKDETTVIKELKYKPDSSRSKQLFNIKSNIIIKFKKLISEGLIDIY